VHSGRLRCARYRGPGQFWPPCHLEGAFNPLFGYLLRSSSNLLGDSVTHFTLHWDRRHFNTPFSPRTQSRLHYVRADGRHLNFSERMIWCGVFDFVHSSGIGNKFTKLSLHQSSRGFRVLPDNSAMAYSRQSSGRTTEATTLAFC
jgi:hypothetical protein